MFSSCNSDITNDLLKRIDDGSKKKEKENQADKVNIWDWTKPESYDFSYSMIEGKKNIS